MPNPTDYAGYYAYRDDFPDGFQRVREWATRVERIVLLAAWEKGWSISDRSSWYNTTIINLFRALSYVLNIPSVFGATSMQFGKTMLDTRKGSVFIVQSRLLWMAYRRWFNSTERTHYNQKIGEKGLQGKRPPLRAPARRGGQPACHPDYGRA